MSYQLLFEQAITLYNENRLDEAEAITRELLIAMPDNIQCQKMLGLIAFDKELYEQASEIFFKILADDSQNTEIILKLAQSLEAWGKHSEAMEYYDRALQISPNDPASHYGKAVCYQAENNKIDAKQEYEKVLELDNGFWSAFLGLASLEDEFDGAMKYLEQALIISPDNPFVLYQIALLYKEYKNYDMALKNIEQACDIYPHVKMLDLMAVVVDANGDSEKSLNIYNDILCNHPHYLPAMTSKAEILIRQNKLEEAKVIIKQVLGIDKYYIDALINLGTIAHKQGLLLEAVETYRKVIEINPEIPEVLLNIGLILHEQGDIDEAVGMYFNVLRIDRNTVNLEDALYEGLLDYCKIDKESSLRLANLWANNIPHSQKAQSVINEINDLP